jgi:hypothetical protein
VTLLWLAAAASWLPWALIAARLLADLALGLFTPAGHSWSQSPFVAPVCDALVLQFGWPHWEGGHFVGGWLTARVGSIFPWLAFMGCTLVAAGWRLLWLAEEGRLRYGPPAIAASILLPPLAAVLIFRDSRWRYEAAEARLETDRQEALSRLKER